jgi:hypothetical protein
MVRAAAPRNIICMFFSKINDGYPNLGNFPAALIPEMLYE